MNKDALLATLIGFAIGLTITGIIIVLPTVGKSLPKVSLPSISLSTLFKSQSNTSTQSAATEGNAAASARTSLTIESPTADSIIQTNKVSVKGSTAWPTILISSDVEDIVASVKNNSFTADVSLKEGKNMLIITAISASGEIQTTTLTVYQTGESL